MTDALISGFEVGTHWPSADKVLKVDAYLEADNALWDLWESLTNGQAYPRWLSGLVDGEKSATRIRTYEPLVIPGLVQTQQYAAALVRASNPLPSPEKVHETVSGRLKRQELWNRPEPPQMLSIINESVLLAPTGGASVMVDQVSRLVELVESHKLGIQIIPMSTRFHPGSTGSFVLMSFRDRTDALYVEDAFAGRIVHEDGTVEQAQELFGFLQSAALSLDMSLTRLNEISEVTKMDLWTWHKSSYSGGNGGNCVEAPETPAAVNIRDTQHRDHGHLTFPTAEWAHLVGDLRRSHG